MKPVSAIFIVKVIYYDRRTTHYKLVQHHCYHVLTLGLSRLTPLTELEQVCPMPVLTVIVKALLSYVYEWYFNYYSWECGKRTLLTVSSSLQVTVQKESVTISIVLCKKDWARKCQQYANQVWKSSSVVKVNVWKKGRKPTWTSYIVWRCPYQQPLMKHFWICSQEYNKLRQKVDELTGQIKQLLSETQSRMPRQFSACVKKCKQTVHKCWVKSKIIQQNCQCCAQDSVGKSVVDANLSHKNEQRDRPLAYIGSEKLAKPNAGPSSYQNKYATTDQPDLH